LAGGVKRTAHWRDNQIKRWCWCPIPPFC